MNNSKAENDTSRKKSDEVPVAITAGILAAIATTVAGTVVSQKNRLMEHGFGEDVLYRDVKEQIKSLGKKIEKLDSDVLSPDEFIRKPLDKMFDHATKISEMRVALTREQGQMKESLNAIDKAVTKDLKYIFCGAVVAAVAVGTAVYLLRQNNAPQDEKLQESNHQGMVSSLQKKIEP
jgi:hypothetical protein